VRTIENGSAKTATAGALPGGPAPVSTLSFNISVSTLFGAIKRDSAFEIPDDAK
jgi:hypothetical protein